MTKGTIMTMTEVPAGRGAERTAIDPPFAVTGPITMCDGSSVEIPDSSLPLYGVDVHRWPSSSGTAVRARAEDDSVIGVLVLHDASGIVLWSWVAPHARRRGVARLMYLAMFRHRGALGIRNGALRGTGSPSIWSGIVASPRFRCEAEVDGGYWAVLVGAQPFEVELESGEARAESE
jgi:hypothetical protein